MLKKTMTYKDFNDVERTEDLYFNMTEAELLDTELGVTGGFAEMIKRIINTKDQAALIGIFKELVLKAYGIKSADGREFRKSEEIRNSFASTQVYSDYYMLLVTDTDEAIAFVNGIMPANIKKKVAEQKATLEIANP